MKLIKNRRIRTCLTLLLVVLGIYLTTIYVQKHTGNYIMSVINKCLIYYLCVASLNIMLGFTGYLNFATIAFMGLSAFVTANLTLGGMDVLLAILVGTLVSGALSYILGLLLLRLKGAYFVFGTNGLVFIATVVFNNLTPFTGGPNGRFNIPKLILFGHRISTFKSWFPVLLTLALLAMYCVYRIKNTALGRSLMAIRDDETAAATLGVNVYRTKIIAFTICGIMAGLSGSILAIHNGVVSASLFKISIAQEFVIMAMLGGILSPIGSFFGTFLVAWLPEVFRFSSTWMNIIYGILIILLIIFMPMGLSSLFLKLVKWLRTKTRPLRTKRGEGKNVMPES